MKNIEGTKESDGKLNYELDFEFIAQMAEKMSLNNHGRGERTTPSSVKNDIVRLII